MNQHRQRFVKITERCRQSPAAHAWRKALQAAEAELQHHAAFAAEQLKPHQLSCAPVSRKTIFGKIIGPEPSASHDPARQKQLKSTFSVSDRTILNAKKRQKAQNKNSSGNLLKVVTIPFKNGHEPWHLAAIHTHLTSGRPGQPGGYGTRKHDP